MPFSKPNHADALPPAIRVVYVRDGFQLIVETGTTVSILLAAATLILLPLFGSVDTHPRMKEFLLAACFASVLLGSFATITATIFCFIIVDRLGGVGFNTYTVPVPEKDEGLGSLNALQVELPVNTKLAFKVLLEYWLFTFSLSIQTLVIAVLIYFAMQAPTLPTTLIMGLVGTLTLLRLAYFMLFRPLLEN